MRADILLLAVLVGACTWAFRVLPTRADLSAMPEGGRVSRLLAATGPAAIATLFTASVLPLLRGGVPLPLAGGTVAVLGVFVTSRSVVGATLAGALAYGVLFALG